MKSILVALDETESGTAAVSLSLALAKARGAAVTGATVLDTKYFTAPQAGAIGAAHYKTESDAALLQQAIARNERLLADFLAQCQAQGVDGQALALEGAPTDALREAAALHDVVAIGRDCEFHGYSGEGIATTVERMLKNGPRPLIVTPKVVRAPARIVVTYDGSMPAARALQMFVLLGLAGDAELLVLSAEAEQAEADKRAQQACAYLGLHGLTARPLPIGSTADPAELVAEQAATFGAEMVVMGAYGHRGWREALLGSFTTRFLARCPAALFIHH